MLLYIYTVEKLKSKRSLFKFQYLGSRLFLIQMCDYLYSGVEFCNSYKQQSIFLATLNASFKLRMYVFVLISLEV